MSCTVKGQINHSLALSDAFLDDLVVVGVGGEDEGRHGGGEDCLLLAQRLPGPGLTLHVDRLLVVQQHLHQSQLTSRCINQSQASIVVRSTNHRPVLW